MVKEVHQCSSCGGFCKKSGCERENEEPAPTVADFNRLRAENARLRAALELTVPAMHRDTTAKGKANYSVVRAALGNAVMTGPQAPSP